MGDCVAMSIYDEAGKQVDVEIVQADPEVDISLELLDQLDERWAHRDGDVLTLGTIGTVQYRIIGPSLTVAHCVRAVKIEGRESQ